MCRDVYRHTLNAFDPCFCMLLHGCTILAWNIFLRALFCARQHFPRGSTSFACGPARFILRAFSGRGISFFRLRQFTFIAFFAVDMSSDIDIDTFGIVKEQLSYRRQYRYRCEFRHRPRNRNRYRCRRSRSIWTSSSLLLWRWIVRIQKEKLPEGNCSEGE